VGFLVQSSFVGKPGHLAPNPDSKCPGIRDDLTDRRPAHNMTTVNSFTVRESASNRSDGGQAREDENRTAAIRTNRRTDPAGTPVSIVPLMTANRGGAPAQAKTVSSVP
jgi:hypothetical protein